MPPVWHRHVVTAVWFRTVSGMPKYRFGPRKRPLRSTGSTDEHENPTPRKVTKGNRKRFDRIRRPAGRGRRARAAGASRPGSRPFAGKGRPFRGRGYARRARIFRRPPCPATRRPSTRSVSNTTAVGAPPRIASTSKFRPRIPGSRRLHHPVYARNRRRSRALVRKTQCGPRAYRKTRAPFRTNRPLLLFPPVPSRPLIGQRSVPIPAGSSVQRLFSLGKLCATCKKRQKMV